MTSSLIRRGPGDNAARLAMAAVLALTACAPGLTSRQTLTWDAYKACQPEGPSTRLEGVRPDGNWYVEGVEGEVFKVHRCMQEYWQRAAREGRVPTVVASISTPDTARAPRPPASLAGSAAVTVPIQVLDNIVLVPVTVNGGQGATLLLDTGAQHTVLTPALAARLGLMVPADAPTKSITVVGGQKITVPFVRLPLIELGSGRVEHIDVGIHAVVPDAPMIDGLLGGDILGRFVMTLDRPARQLRLEPSSLR
jgi:Aspartyl protease